MLAIYSSKGFTCCEHYDISNCACDVEEMEIEDEGQRKENYDTQSCNDFPSFCVLFFIESYEIGVYEKSWMFISNYLMMSSYLN
jgi:hypothetical protein